MQCMVRNIPKHRICIRPHFDNLPDKLAGKRMKLQIHECLNSLITWRAELESGTLALEGRATYRRKLSPIS
jgi:hypothetical protein